MIFPFIATPQIWICSITCVILSSPFFYVLKEALTPVKENPTKSNIGEGEVVESSAFDKLECDQEGPIKFAEFLDSRFVASTVIAC